MAANYGWGPGVYDPYNPAGSFGNYPTPYTRPSAAPYVPGYDVSGQPNVKIGMQMPQNGAQQPTQTVQFIQVPGLDYAKSVMLNPNQTVYMISQNSPELYAKATDAMGVSTMKYFKLVEFDPTVEAAQKAVSSQSANLVSREEFNNFAQNVSNQFAAIQQNIGVVPQQTMQQVQTVPVQQQPISQQMNTPEPVVNQTVQQQSTVSTKNSTKKTPTKAVESNE